MTTHTQCKRWPLVVLALAGCLSGCASSVQTARKEATAHWQKVRSDVARQVAQQQLEKGQLEQARATLRDALAANPKEAHLHLLMARVLFEQRDLSGAQAEVAAAQRLDADLAEADYWNGVLAQAAGQWEETHAAYQVAYAKSGQSTEYLYALVEAKMAMGRCPEAAELAVSRFRDFPRDAKLRTLAGCAMLVAGDLPQAQDLFEQALGLDPTSDEIKQRLAHVLCQAGKHEQAAALLADLLQDEGSPRSDLQLLLAVCQTRSGQYEAAVKTYEACAASDPQAVEAQLRLQEARLLAGQVAAARQGLDAMLERHSRQARAWELLGHACVLDGDLAAARQAYARAIECGGDAARLGECLQAIRAQAKTAAAGTPAQAMTALGTAQGAHVSKRIDDESGR